MIWKNDFLNVGIIAIAVAVFGGAIALQVNANSEENAKEYLSAQGFTNISITGYNWWCAKGTLLRRHFEAKNHSGQDVEGSICANRLILPDSIETTIKKSEFKP